MLDPQSETRGVTAYGGPIVWYVRIGALSIDICLFLLLYSLCVSFFYLSPLPGAIGIGLWLVGAGALWVGSKYTWGLSIGEWIWGLGFSNQNESLLVQKKRLSGTHLTQAWGGTIAIVGVTWFFFSSSILHHPVLQKIELNTETGLLTEENRPLPMYYLLLNWPLEFAGKPIFTSIPYEKGPPKKFPGRLIAHWQSPEIQLVIQGPITPENAPSREWMRECALENRSLSCLSLRNSVLMPEMADLRQTPIEPTASAQWRLSWIETPGISGFWLERETLKQTQIRALLINAKGTQQRLTLFYPSGTLHGKQARSLFAGMIKSASFFEDLQKSRAGIQGELSKVRLMDIERNSGQSIFPKQIATIQALLISKITVDPADFDAYFHLAGTAALLRRKAGIEVLEITQPLIEAMSRYAMDIAPQDSRTAQIQSLLKN